MNQITPLILLLLAETASLSQVDLVVVHKAFKNVLKVFGVAGNI